MGVGVVMVGWEGRLVEGGCGGRFAGTICGCL